MLKQTKWPIAVLVTALLMAAPTSIACANARQPEDPKPVELVPPTYGPDEDWNSMPVILNDLRGHVRNGGPLAGEAARRLLAAHMMSGIAAVLPTPGVQETQAMSATAVREFGASTEAIEAALKEATGEAAVALLDVKLTIESMVDLVQTVGKWTANAEPGTEQAKLLEGRQIRRAFPVLPLPFLKGPEEVVTSDVIGVKECMVVVKEIQGLKLRLRAILLPVWVEPWYARRKIVGWKVVWILEFVPAQFIKRVVTCNDGENKIRPQTLTEVIEHPELLDFWRFFAKGWKPARGH